MDKPGSFAIITTLTPDFLGDFWLFFKSLRRITTVPLIAMPVEFGITIEQMKRLREKMPDTGIFNLWLSEEDVAPFKSIGERWMQWYKPSLIKMAMERCEIETALWLDADIVVLEDLKDLFEAATKDFVVMHDNFAPHDCLNNNKLYEKYPSPATEDEAKIALNSGVVGIQLPRDQEILDAWEAKTKLVHEDEEAREYISLYDQGTLLWAMRDMQILDKVIDEPRWNHNAKRNTYEEERVLPKWPFGPNHMGGGLLEEVRYDNPDAAVVHYAGLPKLSHLCKYNSPQARQYRHNIHREAEPVHIFGVGLERAGTHTLAEVLRRCCRYGSWVRHEFTPALAYAAHEKWKGGEVSEDLLEHRYTIYNRTDVQFIAEINHRLGFFIPEIKERVHNAKFVLMLRNPIDLVRSRLRNFSCWSCELNKLPGHYQFDIYNIHKDFHGSGSGEQNSARLHPQGKWEADVIQMHVWEIVETLRFTLRDLKQLPDKDYQVIWIEEFRDSLVSLQSIIPKQYLYWGKAMDWAGVRFGMSKDPSPESQAWIDEQINEHSSYILHTIMGVLQEFDIGPYERSFI